MATHASLGGSAQNAPRVLLAQTPSNTCLLAMRGSIVVSEAILHAAALVIHSAIALVGFLD